MDIQQLSLPQARKKLQNYRILWGLDIFFLLLCVGCLTASLLVRNHAYSEALKISPATDVAVRQTTYAQAIDLCPNRPDAYLCLLDTYNEDGSFTKAESEAFLSIYNSNHTKLQTSDSAYSKLHYTAGLMYVNGYETDTASRLRMALPFLEEAKSYMNENDPEWLTTSCYCMIGAFYKDYIWNTSASVREVDPIHMQELVDDICSTLTALEKQTGAEAIYNRLGFCSCVCNLFYGQRDLLAATVPKEQVMQVMENIYSTLPEEASLQKMQTKALLQSLLENRVFYIDTLERAYVRTEGSG